MSYILLREAYIANTRDESVTWGDSDKLWLARLHDSFIALYVNLNEAVAHLLQREEGFGHAQLPSCCRGMQLSTIVVR